MAYTCIPLFSLYGSKTIDNRDASVNYLVWLWILNLVSKLFSFYLVKQLLKPGDFFQKLNQAHL